MKTDSNFYNENKYSFFGISDTTPSGRIAKLNTPLNDHTKTKIKFPETKNKKLKHKIHYLHAFWRLNIGDLDFSLNTQLFLKKLSINSVYSLHHFILKKSSFSFFSKEQQNEIIRIYYKFGFNSPFAE